MIFADKTKKCGPKSLLLILLLIQTSIQIDEDELEDSALAESKENEEMEKDETKETENDRLNEKDREMEDKVKTTPVKNKVKEQELKGNSEEETVSSEEETVSSEKETVSSEEETVSSEKETVSSEEETVSSGEETVSSGEETVSSGETDVSKSDEEKMVICGNGEGGCESKENPEEESEDDKPHGNIKSDEVKVREKEGIQHSATPMAGQKKPAFKSDNTRTKKTRIQANEKDKTYPTPVHPKDVELRIHPRIIGGRDAWIGNHPWQLSLQTTGGFHFCGAAMIARNFAVTAAHCVTGKSASDIRVIGGTSDVTDGRINAGLFSITIHQSFEVGSGFQPNDMAILELDTYLADYTDVSTITVSPSAYNDEAFVGSSCTITGWGEWVAGGSSPAILQEADMQLLSNSDCENYWGASYNRDVQVCVIHTGRSGSSACHGDSGGPLVCGGYLIGVASFVAEGCIPSYPSVYARLSALITV